MNDRNETPDRVQELLEANHRYQQEARDARAEVARLEEIADASARLAGAARALLDAVTFDDSGEMGRGGNGGLISRETIRKADELRLVLAGTERPK